MAGGGVTVVFKDPERKAQTFQAAPYGYSLKTCYEIKGSFIVVHDHSYGGDHDVTFPADDIKAVHGECV